MSHQGKVRFCGETTDGPQGRSVLPIEIAIAADGAVSGASVRRDDSLGTCVRDVVRRWSFPAPTGGPVTLEGRFELTLGPAR